jgi:hypothetical protein
MNDNNSSKSNGTTIGIYTCGSEASEKWTISKYSNGQFQLKNGTGICADDWGYGVGTPGKRVYLKTYACQSNNGSEFWVWKGHELENAYSHGCINDPGYSKTNSTGLIIYSCSGSPSNEEFYEEAQGASSGGSSNGSGGTGSGSSSTAEHIISTLYAYPTLASWGQVESGAPTVKYAIVNICAPNGTGSGCGSPATEANPDWDGTIAALKNAGITPLYYISTNYDAEPLATVESELANAKAWYGVANPMFDTTSTNDPGYYQSLYNYAVGLGATAVVFNPGTVAPQSYMFGGTTGSKEIIQMFEGTAGDFEGTSFPAWMKDYPASEFAATLSVGTAGSVGGDVKDAVNDHIGNFYEDDEAESPNYSTLPAFWANEITDVKDAE